MDTDDEEESCFFVFSSKKDYKNLVSLMISEIKSKVVFTVILNKLLLYDGISSVYRLLDIHESILYHLNKITKHTQQEWVKNVCWNIHKNVCISFDSLPFSILKTMSLYELESFLYKIIFNSFLSVDHEGYLDFIEEKNIYISEDENLIDEVNDDISNEILNDDISNEILNEDNSIIS